MYDLKKVNINLDGLLLNADPERFAATIDGLKALLVRSKFSVRNWPALHRVAFCFITFSVIFLRKINKK